MRRHWGADVAGLFLAGAVLSACTVGHSAAAPRARATWTARSVRAALMTNDSGTVTDVLVIALHRTPSVSFAFASYEKHGTLYYAVVLHSAHATAIGTFRIAPRASSPFQANEIWMDGWTAVAGVVVGRRNVKTVVLTFPNGRVVVAPVSRQYFWWWAQVGNAHTAYSNIVGVSAHGQLITDPS